MKLLLDQGLPRTAAASLRSRGVGAVHTGEVGLATAEDAEILEFARADGRAVVTLDADFHALLAMHRAANPSVIRIRIERLRAEAVVELLTAVLDRWNEVLDSGAMLTVQPGRVRIRRLPILEQG